MMPRLAGVAALVGMVLVSLGARAAEIAPRIEVRDGVGNVAAKLEAGEPVTVAFVGGSITALPGWRDRFVEDLRDTYRASEITQVNAGLSSTGSDVAAFRLEEEVLSRAPDLVVLDFAVNDADAIQEIVKRATEGVVRQIWSANPRTDILMVYFFSPRFADSLGEGEPPPIVSVHDRIARHHGIPSIDVSGVVAALVDAGEMKLTGPARTAEGETPAFSRDGVHPHARGHAVYARAVARGWDEIASNAQPRDHSSKLDRAYVEDHWEDAHRVSLSANMRNQSWRSAPSEETRDRSIELWEATASGATIEFGFRGETLKIMEQRTREPGRLELRVDGELLPPDTYRPLKPGPALRVLHVRYEFDPNVVHRVSIRVPSAAGEEFRPVRLGDLLVLGEVVPVEEATKPERLNLLLVTFDTTRPDALGAYGNRDGLTPTIDAMAANGTVFDNVVAPMGATFPSHASIFTGLNPRQHGVRANHDNLDEAAETLAEDLAAAGYDTAAFVAFGSMLSRGGFDQGFSELSDAATGRSTGKIRTGEDVTARALEWLDEPRDRPFFLWLHYFEAHAPYRLTPYASEHLEGYTGPLENGADVGLFYSLGKKIPWSAEERRAVRVLYDGEVRELDRLIAPVLAKLDEPGHKRQTFVVLTADHGQALGEEGRVGHGLSLDESVLRVPLIVRHPSARPSPRRVGGRVGLVDLRPTLLDVLGIEPPKRLDGRSFAGVWRGEPLDDRLYFAEMNEPLWDEDPTEIRRRDTAIYEGDVKVVYRRRGTQSFDLAADPGARTAVPAAARTERMGELEALAQAYHASAEAHSGQVKSPDVADELRALGYLE